MADHLTRLPSGRDRILQAAARLFYAEGIHAVGVDRVTAEAGVAKATLYQQFRSKDELVAACLQRRAEHWRASVAAPVLALPGSPARRAGAVFERLGEAFAAPGYRGCPFINAAAEYPGRDGPVAAAIAAHRAQVRGLFAELLTGVPAARRAALTDQLVLLYDGMMVGAQLDHGQAAARRARAAARQLLDGSAPRP
jgi:AcrR family transcriptional regulator